MGIVGLYIVIGASPFDYPTGQTEEGMRRIEGSEALPGSVDELPPGVNQVLAVPNGKQIARQEGDKRKVPVHGRGSAETATVAEVDYTATWENGGTVFHRGKEYEGNFGFLMAQKSGGGSRRREMDSWEYVDGRCNLSFLEDGRRRRDLSDEFRGRSAAVRSFAALMARSPPEGCTEDRAPLPLQPHEEAEDEPSTSASLPSLGRTRSSNGVPGYQEGVQPTDSKPQSTRGQKFVKEKPEAAPRVRSVPPPPRSSTSQLPHPGIITRTIGTSDSMSICVSIRIPVGDVPAEVTQQLVVKDHGLNSVPTVVSWESFPNIVPAKGTEPRGVPNRTRKVLGFNVS
ncbi:hypothetical protein WA026_019466 [Henosepilachna vigintioctopunctata]|uniref:Uncharacterized protein n=1 Tax=Henosepilachna vigintioctopunctata TaxID=420089 RepID=A0AAW1UCZ6_9CUCU